MANTRNLQVDIDGNPAGFDRACEEASNAARSFDRELERLERAQRAQERATQEGARATREGTRAMSDSEIASRRAGLAAKDAGDRSQKAQDAAARAAERASIAQRNAADAAQALGRGEITAAEAAQAQSRAVAEVARAEGAATVAARQLERAEIAQALAARAAAKEQQNIARTTGLERLATLRASGSVREHNALLTRLRREYGNLGSDVRMMSNLSTRAFGLLAKAGTSAMEGISGGLSSLAQSWPAVLAMVVAGLIALPVVAIAAGGAITLALGGALAGIGILAVAKSAEVKAAFGEFATSAKAQAQAWAAPWKPAIQGMLQQAGQVMHQLGPTMTAMFAAMAPAVQRFMGQLGQGLVALSGSFPAVTAGFTKLLDAVGPQLPVMMEAVGNGIASIAQAAGNHAAEFGQLIVIIGQFVNGLGQMIAWLINAGSAIQKFFGLFDVVAGKPKAAAAGLDAMGAASGRTSVQTALMGGALNVAATSMELASLSAADLKTKLDSLTGKTISAREAQANYAQSIFAMNKLLHANGAAHGFATVKGTANEVGLTNIAKATVDLTEKLKANNASTRDVARAMDDGRAKIIAAAEKMRYTKGQAEALAVTLLGVAASAKRIPAKTETQVKGDIHDLESKIAAAKAKLNTVPPSRQAAIRANIADLQNKVADAKAQLASLHSKTIYVTTIGQSFSVNTHAAVGRARGGYIGDGYAAGGMAVKRYADAGYVSGAGTATSDSIPAMLSDGEYVVNAASTRANRALLEAINRSQSSPWGKSSVAPSPWGTSTYSPWGQANAGGAHSYQWRPARRGLQSYGGASSGVTQVTSNTYHIQGSVWSEGELLDVIQRTANDRNVRNPGQKTFGGR